MAASISSIEPSLDVLGDIEACSFAVPRVIGKPTRDGKAAAGVYALRSERQRVERIDTDLLLRWFVGLGIEDPVGDATSFTQNRDRLLEGEVAPQFLAAVLNQPKVKRLVSSEPLAVDGTVLEGWASVKSCRRKDGSGDPPGPGRNGERDVHRARRNNDTHASTTAGDARLDRKRPGKGSAAVVYGSCLDGEPQPAGGGRGGAAGLGRCRAGGRAQLIAPFDNRPQPVTPGADKGYGSSALGTACRARTIPPHLARNQNGRRSAIERRTTRHPGHAVAQPGRKPIKAVFGWANSVAGRRKLGHRRLPKVDWQFTLAIAACDLIRLPKPPAPTAA